MPSLVSYNVTNDLLVEIDVFELIPGTTPAAVRFLESVLPSATKPFAVPSSANPLNRIMVSETGALVADVSVVANQTIRIKVDDLKAPNHIPPPPAASSNVPVPLDTPPYLVGVGVHNTKDLPQRVLLREQFWRKAPDSLSLSPHSSLQKSLTQTSGRTATSSTSNELSQALDVEVSAGWGPFSASASAAFSSMSQRTDTITVTEESTASVVQTFTNDSPDSLVVYMWQLMDRIHVFKGTAYAGAVDVGTLPYIPLTFKPAP